MESLVNFEIGPPEPTYNIFTPRVPVPKLPIMYYNYVDGSRHELSVGAGYNLWLTCRCNAYRRKGVQDEKPDERVNPNLSIARANDRMSEG